MAARRKYDSIITRIHDEWCRVNGYPVRERASHPNDLLDAENSKRFVEAAKPRASASKRAQPPVASATRQPEC